MTWLNCPECDSDLRDGAFGDNAHCDKCKKSWETDFDYITTDNIAAWTTKEIPYEPERD